MDPQTVKTKLKQLLEFSPEKNWKSDLVTSQLVTILTLPEATAAESATADGLARSEAARLTLAAAAGRSGSLSAGFRGRCVWWPLIPGAAVDLRLTSESVDEFLWRGDGDLSSSGLRLSELLWRPCLASGDGLREE